MGVSSVQVEGTGRPSVRVLLPAFFVGFSAAVIAVHLAEPDGGVGTVSFLTATCGAALVACFALLFRGTDPVRVLLTLGIVASASGDVAWELYVVARGEGPDVSLADVGWLAAYVFVGAALVVLIRRNGVRWRESPDVMFDVATAVVISTIVVWVFWVSPTMSDSTQPLGVRLVWSAYPVLDAVLLGLATRALLERSERSRALLLVASGSVMWLLSDMGFLTWGEDSAAGPALNVGWMLGSILLAAGAWGLTDNTAEKTAHGRAPRERPVGRVRIALAIAPISFPWLIELWAHAQGSTINRLPLIVGTVLLCAVVYARAAYFLRLRHEAELLLRSNERLYRALAAHSSDAVMLCDRDGRLLRDSPSLAALSGMDVVGTAGTDILAMVDLAPSGGTSLREILHRAVSRPGEVFELEFSILNAAAEELWLFARIANLLDDPDVGGVVINLHDITERKLAETAIARSAAFDQLTRLPNRQTLTRRLDEYLATQDGVSDRTGVVLVDVSRFRVINDSLGHGAGDQVLLQLTQRLTDAIGHGDFLARFGGDVFAVLARRRTVEQFADLAARISTMAARPMLIMGRELELVASMGIALTSQGCDTESAFAVADDALHRAKHRGAGRVTILDVAQSQDRVTLDDELELRAAIDSGELELEYQAVVDVQQRRIDGFEALVRWNHPIRGRLGPGSFIPLAEETGLVVPLGAWVLDTAIAESSAWHSHQSVAINLSPVQVAEPGLAEMVEGLLTRHRFDPCRLILEVTESTLVSDDREMTEPLERLRQLGVRIAIDDFGTGYSSFSYLRRLPVDILKIDKSFIDDLPGAGEPIAAAIIALATALGLDVIAEGVEHDDQLDTLERLGCRHIQGFLLHRPEPAAELCVDLNTPTCNDTCTHRGSEQCTERELQVRRRAAVPDGPGARTAAPDEERHTVHQRHGAIDVPSSHTREEPAAPQVATKRTLATLSHAIEEIAAAAGPDATIISLFQRGPYFAPMVARYEQMAGRGSTVIVAYAGDGPTAHGVHHVTLAEDDPLVAEWTIILITSGVAAHVRCEDLIDFDPAATDLESGRRFSATWGFDRHTATDHATQLIQQLEPGLDSELVDQVRNAITVARHAPASVPERSLSAAAGVLANRLGRTQRELNATRARLTAETEIATRDPLTGLLNREGLERWLGGDNTDGLAMPPMGVVLIDLDGFKQINDTLGHLAGDHLLQGVAAALSDSTRPGDVTARWGGDEFVVLCPRAAGTELHSIAQRLLDAIAAVDIDGAHVTASAGIQICTQRPLPLGQADTALYTAKRAGGGRPVLATT